MCPDVKIRIVANMYRAEFLSMILLKPKIEVYFHLQNYVNSLQIWLYSRKFTISMVDMSNIHLL